jgi:hypothetical protein
LWRGVKGGDYATYPEGLDVIEGQKMEMEAVICFIGQMWEGGGKGNEVWRRRRHGRGLTLRNQVVHCSWVHFSGSAGVLV